MRIDIDEMIRDVKVAIDEITGEEESEFTESMDIEIRQAIISALNQLLQELPLEEMDATVYLTATTGQSDKVTGKDDGTGEIKLPEDWLRLYELVMSGWKQPVLATTDPMSDDAKAQASSWTRGTEWKPVVIQSVNKEGKAVLRYFSAHRGAEGWEHKVELLTYIGRPKDDGTEIETALKESNRDSVMYRAAGIYMEARKESGLADRFYALSRAVSGTQTEG